MDKERFIRRCYELAVSAGKKGFDTFGAVLVHNGQILEEAENTAIIKKAYSATLSLILYIRVRTSTATRC